MQLFNDSPDSQPDKFILEDFWSTNEYSLANQLLIDIVLPQPVSQKKYLNRTQSTSKLKRNAKGMSREA